MPEAQPSAAAIAGACSPRRRDRVGYFGARICCVHTHKFDRETARRFDRGTFALENGDGKTVSDQTLRGRPFLVYFGYTHCPDVCPTELAHISDILTKMGNRAIPALFITVDPERDTPKVMQDYVSSFNPAIVGLSGSPQSVEATEKTFRVFARKGEKQPDGDYSMDHSSVVYLMDKNGAFVEAFNVERAPEQAAKDLEARL